MPIKTFKGQLAPGLQEKIHLSTADGLTGYKIRKFQIISKTPGDSTSEFVAQIFLKDESASISGDVDFSNADLLGVAYIQDSASSSVPVSNVIIFDQETFNQDIYITIVDVSGNTVPCNFYIELEQFKLDLVTSTFHTLKNIRSNTQI
jgi:hypothetical protein